MQRLKEAIRNLQQRITVPLIYIKCRSGTRKSITELFLHMYCWYTPKVHQTESSIQHKTEELHSKVSYLVCDSGASVSYLSVWTQGAQVALQVSMGHEFHHHQGGLAFRHNTQQTHLGNKDEGFSFPWSLVFDYIMTTGLVTARWHFCPSLS